MLAEENIVGSVRKDHRLTRLGRKARLMNRRRSESGSSLRSGQRSFQVEFIDQPTSCLAKRLSIGTMEVPSDFYMLIYIKAPHPRSGGTCFIKAVDAVE